MKSIVLENNFSASTGCRERFIEKIKRHERNMFHEKPKLSKWQKLDHMLA